MYLGYVCTFMNCSLHVGKAWQNHCDIETWMLSELRNRFSSSHLIIQSLKHTRPSLHLATSEIQLKTPVAQLPADFNQRFMNRFLAFHQEVPRSWKLTGGLDVRYRNCWNTTWVHGCNMCWKLKQVESANPLNIGHRSLPSCSLRLWKTHHLQIILLGKP